MSMLSLVDDAQLLSKPQENTTTTTSRGRWWVLATYTFVAAMQGLTWSVPGTLEPAFQNIYGMGGDTVQLLLNYGCFYFIPTAVPFMWFIDRVGIRAPTLVAILLVLVANVIRCFANDASLASVILVHISFTLNALAGPVAMGVPSKLAEDWFPANERTTATAIAALGNQSGTVFLYLMVPFLCVNSDDACIFHLNLVLAILSVINTAMFFVYFPSMPPQPPSASAANSREAASSGAPLSLMGVFRSWGVMAANLPYMSLLLSYALLVGLSNAVGALLTDNLASVGADISTAGWIGAAANGGSIVVGIILAYFTDSLKRAHRSILKAVLIGALGATAACYFLYACCLGGVIPASNWGLAGLSLTATAYILASSFLGAAIPLMFDMAAEQTYPQPEATMLTGMTTAMNCVSLAALFAPASSFFSWANWGCAGGTLLGTVALFFILPTSAPRYDLDAKSEAGGAAVAPAVGEEEGGIETSLLSGHKSHDKEARSGTIQ